MNASIYLPTRGRDRQLTLEQLPKSILERVIVVVNQDEELRGREITGRFPVSGFIVAPKRVDHIAKAWQYILDTAHGKFFIMDDDLRFMRRGPRRRGAEGYKLPKIVGEKDDAEFYAAFAIMEKYLDDAGVAMTGLSTRPFCWRTSSEYTDFTRHTQVYGYDAQKVKKAGAKFVGRWPLAQSDFHMQLQLIEAGYMTRCLNLYCSDQAGSGAVGGASLYRTMDALADSARWLARTWPQVVTAVERTTKGSFGGGTRTDVRVQWAKAAKLAEVGELERVKIPWSVGVR